MKSYIPRQLYEELPWIQTKDHKNINGKLVLVRSDFDYVLITMIKLVYALKEGRKNFSELYYDGGIRLKMSYIKYLDFLVDLKFIDRLPMEDRYRYYQITDKGRIFLGLFL